MLAVILAAGTAAGGLQAQSGKLLVIEKGAQSLAIVDPASGQKASAAKETGITGHEVAASADGRYAYVPIYGNSGVGKPGTDGSQLDVIDVASGQVVGTLDFPHGVRPHDPIVNTRDQLLYVTTELDQTVTVIDASNPRAPRIVAAIPTGEPESHMLAISHDGRRGYTANVGSGTVSVIDLEHRKTVTVIPLSKSVQRIAITPDDRYVFTSDQGKPRLAVIDTATNRLSRWIPLPSPGYGGAVTPDGRLFLIALPAIRKVAVIDLSRFRVTNLVDVPASPQAVLIAPSGKAAYVSCDSSGQVAEIDLESWKTSHLIATGKSPDGMAWAGK